MSDERKAAMERLEKSVTKWTKVQSNNESVTMFPGGHELARWVRDEDAIAFAASEVQRDRDEAANGSAPDFGDAAPAAPETQRVDADKIRAQARAEAFGEVLTIIRQEGYAEFPDGKLSPSSEDVECIELAVKELAQSRHEAPATSCRGCNHERHPSLACGECERVGNVCTGLATHRSVGTAPAAQAGLPSAKVAVTTEHLAMWAAGRFGWGHDTYMNSLLRECCEDDIRANLASVQDEHAREREADRRRIEELEKRLKTERAMKEGCQSHLLDIAAALDKSGADHEEDEPTSQRAIRVLADLRRQLGEAQAEVADLLPRLDAAALENTQLGRERDGARNELAEAKRERADYGDKMTARAGVLENELATVRAKVDELESGARVARLVEANRQLKAKVERRTVLVEQALGGRRSNWTLSKWFDWEHTALAELATDAQ